MISPDDLLPNYIEETRNQFIYPPFSTRIITMKIKLFTAACLLLLLLHVTDTHEDKKKGNRKRCPKLSDTDYKVALRLISRRDIIPTAERSKTEQRMYKKIRQFSLQRKSLTDPYLGRKLARITIDGKILLPWEEINKCIEKFYKCTKADGARKLYHQIKEHYYGIGEPLIQKYLSSNNLQRQRRPVFSNKAPLTVINSKTPMERHQVDLVDMRSIQIQRDGVTYKYILSVLDVFSRFLWLRPLQDKSSELVAKKLSEIYSEFGYPRILQSDQGTEFKGVVARLCKDHNIKLIYSSSHHPQSQGKIERSHGTWKEKIRFDLLNEDEVCDWVSKLFQFQQLYNEARHSSIGISPYECMFGIKPNRLILMCDNENKSLEDIEIEETLPNINENITRRLDSFQHMRNGVVSNSDRSNLKMCKAYSSKYPPSKYHLGEKVYVKYIGKDKRVARGGTSITAPRVLKGKITDINEGCHKYKIKYTHENTEYNEWFRVDMITSINANEEKERQMSAKKSTKKTNMAKKTNRILQIMTELNGIIEESRIYAESYKEALNDKLTQLKRNALRENLRVDRDIPSDGNCMFHALSLQLSRIGIGISHRKLRNMIIDFLRNNPVLETSDGQVDFRDFAENLDWTGYLNRMSCDGEWGNNTVVVAAACLFKIPIQIVSSIEDSRPITITPQNIARSQTLYLGHLAEWHYLSLIPAITTDHTYSEESSREMSNYLCDTCGDFLGGIYESDENGIEMETLLCENCGEYYMSGDYAALTLEDKLQNDTVDRVGSTQTNSSTIIPVVSPENSDEMEISLGKPHRGPNNSTDTIPVNDSDEAVDITDRGLDKFNAVNTWLEDRLMSADEEQFGKRILLAKDERAMTFYHFLKRHGYILQFCREIDGDFILLNDWFMDLYDDFRALIRTLFGGLYLVYRTTDVLRWIDLCNIIVMSTNTYEERIVILTEEENYELTRYLWRIRHPDPEDDENSEEVEE